MWLALLPVSFHFPPMEGAMSESIKTSFPMSSLPVLAETNSKLHADIAIIRLLRAGIHPDQISAVYPKNWTPHAVKCFLSESRAVAADASLPMAATGFIGATFSHDRWSDAFQAGLDHAGLSREMAKRLAEKIEDGRTVVGVLAHNEAEAAIAWHVFEHVSAEHVSCPSDEVERAFRDVPALAPLLSRVAA